MKNAKTGCRGQLREDSCHIAVIVLAERLVGGCSNFLSLSFFFLSNLAADALIFEDFWSSGFFEISPRASSFSPKATEWLDSFSNGDGEEGEREICLVLSPFLESSVRPAVGMLAGPGAAIIPPLAAAAENPDVRKCFNCFRPESSSASAKAPCGEWGGRTGSELGGGPQSEHYASKSSGYCLYTML